MVAGREREFTLSHAARLIGMSRHVLAMMCDAEQVTHSFRLTRRGQKRRRLPLSEVERLRGETVIRRRKLTIQTKKAHEADLEASKPSDAAVSSKSAS